MPFTTTTIVAASSVPAARRAAAVITTEHAVETPHYVIQFATATRPSWS
jgi:hypothetical protein